MIQKSFCRFPALLLKRWGTTSILKYSVLKCWKMAINSDRADEFMYIAFADKPLYLRRSTSSRDNTESKPSGTVSKYLSPNRNAFLIFPKTAYGTDGSLCYIKSAIKSQGLYRKSTTWNTFNFSHCVSFPGDLISVRSDGSDFRRCICISAETGVDVESDHEKEILQYATNSFHVWKVTHVNASKLALSCMGDSSWADSEIHYTIVSPSDIKGYNSEDAVSPIFSVPSLSPVYHSYDEARKTLEMCLDFPEVVELLKITDQYVPRDSVGQTAEQSLQHPLVVVEGLDATGKTTLTQILEDKLGAARYYTPPQQITHLRPFFDTLPEIVRRAYYSMGNYIVARDIIRECESRPVIMDRFWHSTTAYGIANETSSGDLPKLGSYVYKWPEDLLKPTLVLFLTVTEEVRTQRLSGRGQGSTFEEKGLAKDQLFRQRLCEAYRRMSDPPCLEIDASGPVESVVKLAEEQLLSHNVKLDTK